MLSELRLISYGANLLLAVLCWHFWHRAVENANTVRVQAEQFAQTQKDSDRQWAAKFAAQQTAYEKGTEDAKRKYDAALADARDATSAFIRMRAQASASRAQGGPSAAATNTSGIPATMPAQTLVDTRDVQICGDTYAYALGAFTWVQSLKEAAPRPAPTGP